MPYYCLFMVIRVVELTRLRRAVHDHVPFGICIMSFFDSVG